MTSTDGAGRRAGEIWLPECRSTNDAAHEFRVSELGTGHPIPLWIASRHQTAGKGRQGRAWVSPPGNLAATLMVRRSEPLVERARLSFHAALAVADAVAQFAPHVAVTLKWPNDVLADGKKISGILLEGLGRADRDDGGANLAIGIGLNLAHHPPADQTRWPATSIAALTGEAPAPEAALKVLDEALHHWLRRDAENGFAAVRAAWKARAAHLGQQINVRLDGEALSGTFSDVDEHGTLILDTAAGPRYIAAGDVHFPD